MDWSLTSQPSGEKGLLHLSPLWLCVMGFVVLPRLWAVERTFTWLNRNRRLAKDFEQTIRSDTAFLYAASVMMLIRRLARYA